MRPLRLELKGFTAFREPAEVDFSDFDVFAVSGPTGSGKSSLLDAMTYALYGRVERVGKKEVALLVSHGLPRMAVTFEFEVGRERYRVTRSTPRRGGGKILVERRDPDGSWVQAGEGADRVSEAEAMILRVLGLSYDGFTRSVLLPQGKFSQFLVGEAPKRREILTELLGLSLFLRMAKRAGAIARDAALVAQERTLTIEREYADVTPESVREARSRAEEALRREAGLAEAARTIAGMLERWREAGHAAEELRSCAGEAGGLAERARAAARDLADLGARIDAADREVERRRAEAGSATASLEAATTALRVAEDTLGSEDALREAAVAARSLREAVRARGERERELRDAVEAAAGLEERVRLTEAGLAARREELVAREAERASAEEALEEARHADLVAAVSAGLGAGDPCPVCARPLPERPPLAAEGAVDRARKALREAAGRLEAAWSAVSEAERAADAARREAEGNARERERLAAAVAEFGAGVAGHEQALVVVLGDPLPPDPGAEVERRLAEREALERAEREAERAAAVAERGVLGAERERDAVASEAERICDRLGAGHDALFERAARVLGRAVAPLHLAPAVRVLAGAEALAPAATDAGAVVAEARAYADALRAFARDLAREAEEREGLRLRLLQEATEAVGDLADGAVGATTLEEVAEAVVEAQRAAAAEVATSRHRAEDAEARLERREAIAAEVRGLQDRARVFRALALELRADRLIAFLQAEALQVLAVAGSERLSNLSEGRYRLACREDEFLVVDTWNGDEERSVRTLSGGETFLASLSLALALAEQVRSLSVAERARLDSLFLDEGFGTLDQETLRTVVDAIERLAGDGRLVGVVTHVRELAEQFPRIEVRKHPAGSSLQVVP